MGEIADMMLDGTLDCITGEYLGEPCGYPRSREDGTYWNNQSKLRKASEKSIRDICRNHGIEDKAMQNKVITSFLQVTGIVRIPKMPQQIEYIYTQLKKEFKQFLKEISTYENSKADGI